MVFAQGGRDTKLLMSVLFLDLCSRWEMSCETIKLHRSKRLGRNLHSRLWATQITIRNWSTHRLSGLNGGYNQLLCAWANHPQPVHAILWWRCLPGAKQVIDNSANPVGLHSAVAFWPQFAPSKLVMLGLDWLSEKYCAKCKRFQWWHLVKAYEVHKWRYLFVS
jgi:hypothetical protein